MGLETLTNLFKHKNHNSLIFMVLAYLISSIVSGTVSMAMAKFLGGNWMWGFASGFATVWMPSQVYAFVPFPYNFIAIPLLIQLLALHFLAKLDWPKSAVTAAAVVIILPFFALPLFYSVLNLILNL